MKRALITGITGQDGSYLAELLLEKGYKVFGLVRRTSTPEAERINHILDKIEIIDGDLLDQDSLDRAIKHCKPDEVYNLAAQSFVGASFNQPVLTAEITGLGVLRMLEAIRKYDCSIKFYQASSSEMFGKVHEVPQTEKTVFHPRSPYGVAKVYGNWITSNYRESYNIFACNGILFNHESPRRGLEFVTRKITDSAAKIVLGKQEKLVLGNLDAKRDWGFAKDYVEAMWLMLQADKPDDYVVATNETHTVREFVEKAFLALGVKITWEGSGVSEKGYNKDTGALLVEVSEEYFRPAEVELLIGDYTHAKEKLNWEPKTRFEDLVKLMAQEDLSLNKA